MTTMTTTPKPHPLLLSFRALLRVLPAFALLCATPACAEAPSPGCVSRGFPQEGSDLPADPAIRFGTLANGLRYVIRPNREPKNRAALYLNVQAGSLHEQENQRGLAHFLEHMLFNGSEHYPPGTLVKYFQAMGMDFGADSNAHTSYEETVYKLVLPATDEKTLKDSLVVLADFARGALLPEEEVRRERGVIFAEKRSRDTAAARVRKGVLAFDFAGSLLAERDPIGTETALNAADADILRAFYDDWYRPDKLILVMVGDLDPDLGERLVREHLAALAASPAAQAQCPRYGSLPKKGLHFQSLVEPELGYTEISLATSGFEPAGPDNLARKRRQLREVLAMTLFNNRLQQLERSEGSPVSKSTAYAGSFVPPFRYAQLNARAEADKWGPALDLLVTALEQALTDGFTEAELARGKKELLALLEREAQTAEARDSRELAMEIVRDLNAGDVTLSPAQQQKFFAPIVEKTTLDEVNETLRALWPHEPRFLTVAGTAFAPAAASASPSATGRDAQIGARYAAALDSAAAGAKPWKEEAAVAFPYLPQAKQAAQPTRTHLDPETKIETLEFAGGVTAHLKRTDFQPNQVLLSLVFGPGVQGEPRPGAALLAQGLVRGSGTATMSLEQLDAALAGTSVELTFAPTPESFLFQGKALSGELERLLQLAQARILDPGFRPEAFAQTRERLGQMFAQMAGSVEGVQQLEGAAFLGGGSRFYAMPSRNEVMALTLPQMTEWLRPLFAQSPLEINLVGDFDPETARRLLGLYFGGEKREAQPLPKRPTPRFPAGQSKHLHAPDTPDKALVALAWPTDDFWDIRRTRALNLLASVLDDRVRLKVREELGAAYSPRVMSLPSRIDPGFGIMECLTVVAPAQAERVAEAARQVAAGLAKDGVTEEEFKRALEPTLTAIREQLRHNDYWLNTVLTLSSRHPEQREWPKTMEQEFTTMRPETLSELARQYLGPDRMATVLIRPEPGPEKQEKAAVKADAQANVKTEAAEPDKTDGEDKKVK